MQQSEEVGTPRDHTKPVRQISEKKYTYWMPALLSPSREQKPKFPYNSPGIFDSLLSTTRGKVEKSRETSPKPIPKSKFPSQQERLEVNEASASSAPTADSYWPTRSSKPRPTIEIPPTPPSLPPGNKHGRSASSYTDPIETIIARKLLVDSHVDIRADYTFGEVLGTGASGSVSECLQLSTGYTFACKSISKDAIKSPIDVRDMLSEVETLTAMNDHPFVTQLHDVFEDRQEIHLVMEHCRGGDLFGRIKELKRYTEAEAAIVCAKVASVLEYAHGRGIMHRDIKPENILLISPHSNTDVRLADFGSATFFKPGQRLNQLIGSPLYVSPSVLNHNYGPEADLWSLGIVLYIMLCGMPPFWGKTNAEIFSKVRFGQLDMTSSRWEKISPAAKDLVKLLLTRDDFERISAKEIKNHPWILRYTAIIDKVNMSRSGVESSFKMPNKEQLVHRESGLRRGMSVGAEMSNRKVSLLRRDVPKLPRSVLGRSPSPYRQGSNGSDASAASPYRQTSNGSDASAGLEEGKEDTDSPSSVHWRRESPKLPRCALGRSPPPHREGSNSSEASAGIEMYFEDDDDLLEIPVAQVLKRDVRK